MKFSLIQLDFVIDQELAEYFILLYRVFLLCRRFISQFGKWIFDRLVCHFVNLVWFFRFGFSELCLILI